MKNRYFSGETLFGDDFTIEKIKQWYEDEKEAYANLSESHKKNEKYEYHELNKHHGFNKLPNKKFESVLGFGSAHGEEFHPIIRKINKITIIEPSDAFKRKKIRGKPCVYLKPEITGKMNFPDESFDLILCFGTLHHIPNVSFLIREMNRCLKKEGYLIIREPIVSMGDWTKKRKNLTKRERGIPLKFFHKQFNKNNLKIVNESTCLFPLMKIDKKWNVLLDKYVCKLMKWNLKYHPTNIFQKLRPTNGFFVLQKKVNKN